MRMILLLSDKTPSPHVSANCLAQHILFGRRQQCAACFLSSRPDRLPTLDIPLGLVVHPQAEEGEADSDGLDSVDGLAKPYYRHTYHRDALDEAGNGVRDGRGERQDGKGQKIL